jgi:hypothetical protein
MTREPLSSLQALANQLRIQLLELPEYRALTVIDRTILELSEILSRPATSPANPLRRRRRSTNRRAVLRRRTPAFRYGRNWRR